MSARSRAVLLIVCVFSLGGCFLFVNLPPVAQFQALPGAGEVPLVISFNASQSYDDDGSIVSYAWQFGDGWSGTGAQCTHTYVTPGTYVVSLTVTDDSGDIGTATATVIVTAQTTIDRSFSWHSHGGDWEWQISIPTAQFAVFQAIQVRAWCQDNGFCDWYKYVTDPRDDAFIETLSTNLWNAITPYFQDPTSAYYGFLQFVLDFVSEVIPYTLDSVPDEWPRYPLETLVEGIGDCEDTGILYLSIVRPYVVGAHLLFFPGHVAAGVPVGWDFIQAANYPIGYYEHNGQYYVLVETTGDPPTYWQVGELPGGLESDWVSGRVWFYDVSSHIQLTRKPMVYRPE